MANYHFEVKVISRGKGRSVTKEVNYISGEKLYDTYKNKMYYHHRQDVLYCKIYQPVNAPPEFYSLQALCDNIEAAETRYDARTAREIIGSLPNELPGQELVHIVNDFVTMNFIDDGLCVVAAIHEGRNEYAPSRNNPHVHIIVPTRRVGPAGFDQKKDREHDKRQYIDIWRRRWAFLQNIAYKRNKMDLRVSHESLEDQGIHYRKPTCHISRIDWQRERRGERTIAGDKKREIDVQNKERLLRLQAEQFLGPEIELELSR